MSTLPDRNEFEFAKIEEIANSENDHPVFMLNLNKYFDRSGFLNQNEKYSDYIKTVYAILHETGGKMLWRSTVHDQMVGNQKIDEIWAVWYPSHKLPSDAMGRGRPRQGGGRGLQHCPRGQSNES